MNSVLIDLLLLIMIFVMSSAGSWWLMKKMGYPVPGTINGRASMILILMKVILMTILAILLIVILWFAGINPLYL